MSIRKHQKGEDLQQHLCNNRAVAGQALKGLCQYRSWCFWSMLLRCWDDCSIDSLELFVKQEIKWKLVIIFILNQESELVRWHNANAVLCFLRCKRWTEPSHLNMARSLILVMVLLESWCLPTWFAGMIVRELLPAETVAKRTAAQCHCRSARWDLNMDRGAVLVVWSPVQFLIYQCYVLLCSKCSNYV